MRTSIVIVAALLSGLLTGQTLAADGQKGQATYELWCADCHAATGGRFGMPPAGYNVLQRRYQDAKPGELSKRTDLDAAYIKTVVRNGLNIMPRTRKTEISDAQLDDLAAYLTRNNP